MIYEGYLYYEICRICPKCGQIIRWPVSVHCEVCLIPYEECLKMEAPVKEDLKGKEIVFSTGSKRMELGSRVRYDLVSPIGLERLAMTYAEGAEKYGDHNWELGQPFSDIINHIETHIHRYKKIHRLGINVPIKEEDHLAHAAWGLFALMHFEETMPEMSDLLALKIPDAKPTYHQSDKHQFTPKSGDSSECIYCDQIFDHDLHIDKQGNRV